MGTVSRLIPVPIERAYAAISTPDTYPHWLLGARNIDHVDVVWPAPGATFRHRVGLVGPLKIPDVTTSIEVHEPTLLVLEVRARPIIRARVTFRLTPQGDGGSNATMVTIDEQPIGPHALLRPILGPITDARNRRSLASLADLLQAGTSHRAPG